MRWDGIKGETWNGQSSVRLLQRIEWHSGAQGSDGRMREGGAAAGWRTMQVDIGLLDVPFRGKTRREMAIPEREESVGSRAGREARAESML